MMKSLNFILSLLLLPYFICPPQAFGQIQAGKSEMLYQRLVTTAEKKVALVASKLPPGNVILVQSEKNQAVREELEARISHLKSATNAEVAQFKKELIKTNEQELTQMRKDLQGYLAAMTDSELRQTEEFIRSHRLYKDSAYELDSAFTNLEKQKAIRTILMDDLSFLRSVYNKKIGLATKSALIKDLEANLKFFDAQASTKADNKKLLQISLLVLAGVALITWGISSAVYGARLNRVESARETQLNELKASLEAQYQLYKADLTQRELDFLNTNGFVRTVCGTFSQPDSKLCNRYNYGLFSGTKHCTVYCMKNIQTGKETLHEPAVCSSPFIPSDCYDPKEYWDAYARGQDDGYDDGYSDGRWDGREDGASHGRSDGEDDGYDDGFDDGYDDGYADGYDSGVADSSKMLTLKPKSQSEAYKRGFRDGLEQYQILFLNH